MFIHFGLYSAYGGVYDGKPVTRGYSEQIQSFAGIFSDWYAQTADTFNPVKWNPDSIVALAKDAGMKSIVFTSKHHDGFCMYHSNYTDFNIVDATPYKRDIMKELADACARGGIGFSVYFSLIDWHFPQAYPISSHNADPLTPEHYAFNLKQVEEIMKNYGPISEIWFDMGSLTPAQSKRLYELVNCLQPNCMISGRLGNDFVDFAVMADNEYPDYKIGVPWQTAASIFHETWSYRSWQKRDDLQGKINEKIESLVKVISRGGNFLLNIGPRGDGSIVEFERDVLLGIGKWIDANSEAIYATKANPFDHAFEWGDITQKSNDLYLFVKKDFVGKNIELFDLNCTKIDVSALVSGEKCTVLPQVKRKTAFSISVPKSEDNIPYIVLKASFPNGMKISPTVVLDNKTRFTPENATFEFGHSSLDYYGGYKSLIAYNWAFRSSKKQLAPEIFFTDNEKGKTILFDCNGKSQSVTLDNGISKTEKVDKNSVRWGNLFSTRGKGVFGNVEEENHFPVSMDSTWTLISDFAYGEELKMPLRERGSIVFLQEIESTKAQSVPVEIGSGNAIYILLNGKYITAHFSSNRDQYKKELLILPLQKGKNQLVVKFYNRYEKSLNYSVTPRCEWNSYSQKLSPIETKTDAINRTSIRLANPESKVSPLQLNNFSMRMN